MSTPASSPRDPKRPRAHYGKRLQIRLTEEEMRLFSEAAERQHLSLSAWIRLATLHAGVRAEAPGAGRRSPKTFGVRGTALQLRLTEDEKRLFSEAAERRELSVSAWIRLAGLRAAKARPPHQTKFMPLCT